MVLAIGKKVENEELDKKVQEWLEWDKNEDTRAEIIDQVKAGKSSQLEKLLLSRMQFGTAGLRGQMGAGYNQMNDLVIIQTSQGFAKYLLRVLPDVKQKGVVIGFDGRHNSRRFAELAVCAFVQEEIPVRLYSEMCPTPFVPYAVVQFKCSAGIMVTASHNPKDDNGYKVYWENGAQIIPPHDKGIQASILENLQPWPLAWDRSMLDTNPLVKDPLPEVMVSYYRALKESTLSSSVNSKTPLIFTFTPMHGVSYKYMVEAFKLTGFKPFVVVEEQKDPDPEFPTVKFPNPEEGKSALDLSMKTANEHDSTIILANDPDADRLAVAEKQENGEWKVFTGNEMGSLLGWWTFYCWTTKNPNQPVSDMYFIASTVSSKMLRAIANKEGLNFVETLTGFKWMGNKACELLAQEKTVLFAFEEAIGFMCGVNVVDKDGVSAAIRVAELAAFLETKGMTLNEKLRDLYLTYGYHVSENSYYLCYNPLTIQKLFNSLRNFDSAPNTYPKSIINGKYKVKSVRDLTTGYDSSQPDKKAVLPVSKSSQMITFAFENGLVATLRTSGTEPKIKYYTELCAQPDEKDWCELDNKLQEMVQGIINEFLRPKEFELVPRSQ